MLNMPKIPKTLNIRSVEDFIIETYGMTWRELREFRRCRLHGKTLALGAFFLFAITAYGMILWGLHL